MNVIDGLETPTEIYRLTQEGFVYTIKEGVGMWINTRDDITEWVAKDIEGWLYGTHWGTLGATATLEMALMAI